MKIHVGTSGYGHKEWIGKFYPEKIQPREMLGFYSQSFRAVEINNTFYHMPTETVLASWAAQVRDDFIFAIKAPQVITHLKQLRNVQEETRYLFRTLAVLDAKLGPVLFQFPKSFHADKPALEAFLGLLPEKTDCAFDFRSQSWQDAEILALLRKKGYSFCIEDTDENQANKIINTAPWGYLRLRRSEYTDADLSQWAGRILSQKWEKAFVFFKHEDAARGPGMAIRFKKIVNSKR
jgi:uncharacterized protein YecE (DUF72 family)